MLPPLTMIKRATGPVGRTGKLTSYINAVKNYKASPATVKAIAPQQIQRNALGPRFGGQVQPSYIDTTAPVDHHVRAAAAAAAAAAAKGRGGGGGNKKTTVQTAQDTLAEITNRYIASLQTPQQQSAAINAAINASLKQSGFATNAAFDKEKKDLLDQQARAHQYAMALGSLRDMSGLQTEADYTNAARNIQGLGTGLTGTIADAQQAESDQAAQQIAAATQGFGQAQGLDVAGMKNIAQYTGVTMPSTTLYGQAASHAGEARLQQDMRAQQVENIASGYGDKIAGVADDRATKLAELAATRGSLYQTALQAAQSGNRSDLATIISALALQNQTAKTPSEIGKNVAEAGATTAKGAAATTTANTGVAKVTGITKDGKLVGGYYWSAPGQASAGKIPTGLRLDPNDPTHHNLVPTGPFHYTGPGNTNPQPVPKDWLVDPTDPSQHRIIPNKPFFWDGPGKTNPTLIPPHMMLDPKDPTHHRIIVNTAAATGGSKGPKAETPAQRDSRIQRQIKDTTKVFNTGGANAILGVDTLYVHDAADQWGVKNAGDPHQYRPKMSYAAAVADIKKKLPPALRNNPQMLSVINGFLQLGGYKIGGKTKTTTTRTKSTGISNVSGVPGPQP